MKSPLLPCSRYILPRSLRLLQTGAAIVLLAAAATACSDDVASDQPQPGHGGAADDCLKISFTLTTGDNAPAAAPSRATPEGGDGYDRGQGYENYIDLTGGDFSFYLFDPSNVCMAEMAVSSITALESPSASSKRYSVTGTVTGTDLSGSFKIVAAANWRYRYPVMTPGVSTVDDLCSAVYDFSEPFMPSASTPIPLFGVKSYADLQFDEAGCADGGTLHLLRAMAKVEVVCPSGRWSLAEVTMTRYNTSGYAAPRGVYEQDDYVHGSWADDYTAAVSIPEGTAQAEALNFAATPTPDGRTTFTLFVPEFSNTDATGTMLPGRAQIDIRFNESPRRYTLEFHDYEDGVLSGRPYDISRNCWYRYTVNKRDEWSDLDITLDIEPYSEVVLTPDFGLDRDEKGRIIFFRDGATVYLLDTDTHRCFTENTAGEPTYVDSIYDRAAGIYIYRYVDGYGCFWDRSASRWYFRCDNGEMMYVSFNFNGSLYYYDPVRRQCFSFEGGVRHYVDRIVSDADGTVLYQYHEGISYFYDPVSGEYYYRTSYGDRVDISMTIDGVHYLYDLSKKMFYIEGTDIYVTEITDPATGRVVYRHDADLNKSFFLDTATGEYYYRNPLGDKVFVTMTVDGTRYYFSLEEQRYFHYTPDKTFVDIITDTVAGRIVYRYVNGIAYFWDSRRMKYYYRDSEGLPTYVDNLPNN